MASIRFLGAAGTVTGSRYLVEAGGRRVLVDAGLFQGLKEFRLRNWAPFPVPPATIDAVVLTHAHIDHTGALPLLVRSGFRGDVLCTPATADLARIMLPDSAKLQEEEARYANAKGYSRHAPRALPLYDPADAVAAIEHLRPLRYGKPREIVPGFTVEYRRAGHILGSASVLLTVATGGGDPVRILFSGDLGRYHAPILPDPDVPPECDFLVVESTYGDRTHPAVDPAAALEREILAGVARGGAIVIPAFAIGRTQEVLFLLRQLEQARRIPELPVFVDSPMATDATPVYRAHREDHDTEMDALLEKGIEPFAPAHLRFTRSTEESKGINRVHGPCIIVSASGMATGGRVLHHLERRLPDPSTTVLLVGFQAAGTRGASLAAGAPTVRMHGVDVPVRARVSSLPGFSAHGDRDEVARWLDGLARPPRRTFCVHGEPTALAAQAVRLSDRGWDVHVPAHLETVELGVTLLDGAMGTALIARGLPPDRFPETWLVERPREVADVHAGHVRAGASIVTTCTFNLARLDAAGEPLDPVDLARRAVALARAARPQAVAGGVGPAALAVPGTGAAPEGALRERFAVAFGALAAAGVDLLLAESQLGRSEALAALQAGRAAGLPVHVTCWLRPSAGGPVALDGTPGIDLLEELRRAGAAAVGVNCVPADDELVRTIAAAAARTPGPLVARPSAGLPGAIQDPARFAEQVARAARAGATFVGGCCGSGPEHLRAIATALALPVPAGQARG